MVSTLTSVETGAPEGFNYILQTDDYIQHNVNIPNGFAAFGAYLQTLDEPVKVDTQRQIREGDLVVSHNIWNFGGPQIGFDILRYNCGVAVEHWDNLQSYNGSLYGDIPQNPNGRSMVEGPKVPKIVNTSTTMMNKQVALDLVTRALVNGDASAVEDNIADEYLQHNPGIADGKNGLYAALGALAEAGLVLRYVKVHAVIAEGNFVLTVSEGLTGPEPGSPASYYDLFRIEDGMVHEHWDVIEPLAPMEEWADGTAGKFTGFPAYVKPESVPPMSHAMRQLRQQRRARRTRQ